MPLFRLVVFTIVKGLEYSTSEPDPGAKGSDQLIVREDREKLSKRRRFFLHFIWLILVSPYQAVIAVP